MTDLRILDHLCEFPGDFDQSEKGPKWIRWKCRTCGYEYTEAG